MVVMVTIKCSFINSNILETTKDRPTPSLKLFEQRVHELVGGGVGWGALTLVRQRCGEQHKAWVRKGQTECNMQVSISSKTIPPRTRLKEGKKPHPGQSLRTKPLPSGQNKESNSPPPGHKVRKFHKYIYKL